MGIDAGIRERAVSAGGRDGTVRVWKIVEESQLLFNGPATSIDAVKLINEEHFVSCGEDGYENFFLYFDHYALLCIKSSALINVQYYLGFNPFGIFKAYSCLS